MIRWASAGSERGTCAEVYALESTFRRHASRLATDRDPSGLGEWGLMDRRVAEAKIMLLTTDDALAAALEHLAAIGKQTYRATRDQTDGYATRIDEHREALVRFATASQHALREEKVI